MTCKDWFETMPEPYRSKAISYCSEFNLKYNVLSLRAAVNCFPWSITREGRQFWQEASYGNFPHAGDCVLTTGKNKGFGTYDKRFKNWANEVTC